ncbi:MAG: UDP-forming cellulose synthase catalytic subunit [Acidobacteriaceae bacterium]
MTKAGLWKEFESGDSFLLKVIRFVVITVGILTLIFTGILYLSWPEQAVLGLLMVLLAIWLDRSSTSYLVTLTLMLMSMFSTFRYGWWRISTVVKFFIDPGNKWGALDAFFIWVLVGAEAYAFVILFLGFMQTIWPLRRMPVPLPEEPEDWPEVDLLIPTYNEPLNVVRYTALAAMNIDWPADKLNVYIIDDGKREEFRQFAEDAGIGYMTRNDNKHAKAGNINRALEKLHAPYVAIFDCDHVPTRSFLQVTMGWFLRDKKLAMLQTPHHFYSPDPFERNLGQFRVIPNEGELFYGVVQDGNDFWNATFFCGSCAVLRRSALDEIGGIAVETVTEDAHTSLKMQIRGWNTAYINIPQAAGLATERLSGHVKQRIRWARGMIQVMRSDNPLFARGLKPAQRLCYFNAMTHFLYGLPRLIFLTAPLIYLILGHTNVPGYWAAILAYAFPHLTLSNITNSRIQGQHRHSFWNEIYETVLAPYIFLPTMLALVNPKLGSFNVTAKGGVVNKSFFDSRIAQPFLLMLALNMVGLLMAIPRYFFWDTAHPGTVLMNVLWTCFNVIVLGVATAVAWESQQRRQHVRVNMSVPARLVRADGQNIAGETVDLSSGGTAVRLPEAFHTKPGEPLTVVFPLIVGDAELPVTVIGESGNVVRVQFDPLTLQEEEMLTMVLYSRADTWLGWGEARESDRPLVSLGRIFKLSLHGLSQTIRGLMKNNKSSSGSRKLATSITPVLLLVGMLFGLGTVTAQAAPQRRAAATVATPAVTPAVQTGPPAPGTFKNVFALSDIGVPDTIELRGVDAYHSIYFSLPQTEVVKTATMHLQYHFSPGLIPALSHLKVSINGTLFATLPVVTNVDTSGTFSNANGGTVVSNQGVIVTKNHSSALLEADLDIPADLLVRNNQITFEFIGHYTLQCEDPANTTLWSQVDDTSTISLSGDLLPLQNDLKILPMPFYDSAVNLHPTIPIVFMNQPTNKDVQAAGIVASWFGVLTNYRAVHFPVSFGSIPAGNVVLITDSTSQLPSTLNMSGSSGPMIAMRTNPTDPYGKVLIISGDDGDQLVAAARALALQPSIFQGAQAQVPTFKLPDPRQPDDAPRWLSTDKATPMWDYTQGDTLQGDGSVPIGVYLRIPPDLYYASRQNLSLFLDYRYNGIPLADSSSLQVFFNNGYVSSTPLPHTTSASQVMKTEVPVPVYDLRPFSNTVLMKFFFQIAKKNQCQDTAPLNLQGAILRDSYLDLHDIPHWASLPNLELFSNAGFPFTRMADLSETTVVLPDNPSSEEIEMFLTMMGHFGAQTGYPALRMTVAGPEAMKAGADTDFLVMGTVDDQPALNKLGTALPVSVDANGVHVQDTQGFFAPTQHAWWKIQSSDHIVSGDLATGGGLPDALIEGIESPYKSGRSVVVIAVKDHAAVPQFLTAFLKADQSSDIANSVSVLHGNTFDSYRIGSNVYHVGYLSLWTQLTLWFSQFPWMIVVLVLVVCILMAVWLRAWLRRRARKRLQGEDDE